MDSSTITARMNCAAALLLLEDIARACSLRTGYWTIRKPQLIGVLIVGIGEGYDYNGFSTNYTTFVSD